MARLRRPGPSPPAPRHQASSLEFFFFWGGGGSLSCAMGGGLILKDLIRPYLDGETEAQRAQVSHPRPHCELRVNLGLESRLSGTPARLLPSYPLRENQRNASDAGAQSISSSAPRDPLKGGTWRPATSRGKKAGTSAAEKKPELHQLPQPPHPDPR